jgi:predicted AlkP superfamily phosphohydrolase/phosphomutase
MTLDAAVSRRVMMIGLDAASLEFIKSSLASLPNLRRALESGITRTLRSKTTELLPAATWPTLYTGTPPGVHGFYYPMQWDPQSMRLRHVRDWFYCEPFWYELDRRGHRVIAVDVPMTWPSRLRHGMEITDWGAHDSLSDFTARPSHLEREVRRRFGKHPIGREIPVQKSYDQLARARDTLVAGVRQKARLTRSLLTEHPWDFFITVFGETHRAGHFFWPSASTEGRSHPAGALLDVYRAVDTAIGELLEAVDVDNTTVMIFSGHGMGPNASQEHFTRLIMDRINERFDGRASGAFPRSQPPRQRSLMRRLRENLPAPVQHALGQAVPSAIKDLVVDRAVTAGHDWAHTPALAILASVTGYVRFNLQGREARGMLEAGSEAFARYSRWMHDCFHGFTIAETGEPLVNEITLTRDVFPGERQSYLPDAVISWNGLPASRVCSDLLGTIEAPPKTGRAGNHHPEGFAIVVKRGRAGATAAPADILDIKPMVFQELGEHV